MRPESAAARTTPPIDYQGSQSAAHAGHRDENRQRLERISDGESPVEDLGASLP